MKELLKKINTAAPGALLENRPFGRTATISYWVEVRSIESVAQEFCAGCGFSGLENMSAMEIEQTIVISYFIKSQSGEMAVLRCSVVPGSADSVAEVPSVEKVWSEAGRYEDEISELFGVVFGEKKRVHRLLPEGWRGFPLRKSYAFPSEFNSILHMRPPATGGGEIR
ncbi:MAG: hypothetical protein A2583_06525 [Bdellovibrionales bacterium RIFOXYD1_FULL_53_11]|nr:MAG: hypothetical protein A2583_06525 [Bdellovibrionales bacterium RIFOXYD1_FULL_53_11]